MLRQEHIKPHKPPARSPEKTYAVARAVGDVAIGDDQTGHVLVEGHRAVLSLAGILQGGGAAIHHPARPCRWRLGLGAR